MQQVGIKSICTKESGKGGGGGRELWQLQICGQILEVSGIVSNRVVLETCC